MRLLLINYRYFVSGGPERYMFNVQSLLETQGHDVIPFSINYDQNESTPYARYFAPPLSDASEVYFREQSANPRAYVRTLERAFYSRTVYRKLRDLIAETQPDVALVLHYLRKLSPSVLKCLSDAHVPFAVRLSDFVMVCPNAHLIRDLKPCELCVGGALRNSVRYACVQGSYAASAVNYAATRFHQLAGYYDLIQKFIVPSRFTIEKMVQGGWAPDRFVHVPTFVWPPADDGHAEKDVDPNIAYVGRLEPHKGVKTLLQAVRLLEADSALPRFLVRIAGDGPPGYVQSLKDFASRHDLRSIRFEGSQDEPNIGRILSGAWCSVVPSLWYENMPNAALESMARRTAVVASNHGSLPEVVPHGSAGLLTEPGDPSALAAALRAFIESRALAEEMGTEALHYVRVHHSPKAHCDLLMQTFEELRSSSFLRVRS